MLRLQKVLLSVFSAVFLLSSWTIEEENSIEKNLNNWLSFISEDMSSFHQWENAHVVFESELVSFDTNGKYALFTVYDNDKSKELGYVITDQTNKVIEFSSHQSPYKNIQNALSINNDSVELFYSPGFHGCITLNNNIYSIEKGHLANHSLQSLGNLVSFEFPDEVNVNANHTKKKIISGVSDFPYRKSCIPTAIANVLDYWGRNGYPKLRYSNDSSGAKMIDEINSYMESNTSNDSIPMAIQTYCRKSTRYPGRFSAYNRWYPSFAEYETQINQNRPTLVGFAAGGAYGGAHMTVGVGYYYESYNGTTTQDRYIYVHDAWSSTPLDYFVLWSSANDFIGVVIP